MVKFDMVMHAVLLSLFTFTCPMAQQSLTETKRFAYGNPFSMSNENFINVTNALEDDKLVRLLMYDEWKELEARGIEDELIVIDSANYHIEADKILFVQSGAMYELFPEKIKEVKLHDKLFLSVVYEAEKKQLRRGYFEVIREGEYRLLKKWELQKRVTNSSPLGLPAAREEKLTREETFFYQTSPDRRPIALPKKKTDFIEIFRRDRRDMTEYAKSNKLSPKSEEDVIMMFDYYNSLAD